jgi:hypothetical protein
VIEKQFREAAKERREHLPEASLREISLHYVDAWVAANEERLGIAINEPTLGAAGAKSKTNLFVCLTLPLSLKGMP